MTTPVPGDCVLIGGAASVQFAGDRSLVFRVVSVSDTPTYHGWGWLTGYVLDDRGLAREKREVYVHLAGLRPVQIAGSGQTASASGPPVPPPRRGPTPAARRSGQGRCPRPARTLAAAGRR